MHPGLPGRVQGAGWLHQTLVLRKKEGMRCLEGTGCLGDIQPLCICLAIEESSESAAPFSACWFQAPKMEFTPLFLPTRFLGDPWLESLCLPWLGRSPS